MNMYVIWFELTDTKSTKGGPEKIISRYLDGVSWDKEVDQGFGFSLHPGNLEEVNVEMIGNLCDELKAAGYEANFRIHQLVAMASQSTRCFPDLSKE